MGDERQPYVTIRARKPAGNGTRASSVDSTYGSGSSETFSPPTTHDISRVSYHVKHLDTFAETLQESASKAFPNKGRSSQRYKKVQALLLHWKCDDLFVLPELEDLEKCLRDDYSFETDIFAIPSENSHLELMMRLGSMIKDHESTDTLFIIYYGGHAKIDESRQSTWCATRHNDSPWLQWSAIQTLLERSMSDTLILLDCCAGAASATFPNGQSITETISASSWDAIAPHPGRYSFTNAIIEVLQEWRMRTFSAAMLHAEVLARLKHPRPVTINGKLFEARSTPVHFMMTSNHKAASIELSPIIPASRLPPSPPQDSTEPPNPLLPGRSGMSSADGNTAVSEPNEDEPHVMISLALEDDQQLDLDAWQQWLASFPALAKYVKVQGVFRSHSTLLLLSLPVMIWDLLPDDRACSFVAFIRSNNLLAAKDEEPPQASATEIATTQQSVETEQLRPDTESVLTGTTYLASSIGGSRYDPPPRPALHPPPSAMSPVFVDARRRFPTSTRSLVGHGEAVSSDRTGTQLRGQRTGPTRPGPRTVHSAVSLHALQRQRTTPASPSGAALLEDARQDETGAGMPIMNQVRSSRRTVFASDADVPDGPLLATHVINRLEDYYQRDQNPSVAMTEIYASNLGVEPRDLDRWFYHRRLRDMTTYNLQNLKLDDTPPEAGEGVRMILPGHLSSLLDILLPKQVLIVDLRARSAFEKSHIYSAVNLRAPASFVESANFEMLEMAFADDESRRTFSKWFQARCVVFYDRAAEFAWECPVAQALVDKFQKRGWPGHCFVLKGHYREFSTSFDKYIVGDTMSSDASENVDRLRERPRPSTEKSSQIQQKYQEWLSVLETSDRVYTVELTPPQRAERVEALAQRQRDLEAEFEDQFPDLHKKALALRPLPAAAPSTAAQGDSQAAVDFDSFDAKAHLVEPLSRGLEKMHEASREASTRSTTSGAPSRGGSGRSAAAARHSGYQSEGSYVVDKLGDVTPSPAAFMSDDYDEIDPGDEQLRDDPAFQRAGSRVLEGGAAGAASPGEVGSAAREAQRRAGGKERPFWKRIRSAK